MNILAFDFGGTFVKYCLVNEKAEMREYGKLPAPVSGREAFLDLITDLYRQYPYADGIAVSMPGVIDSESGRILLVALYPEMNGENLYDLLKEKIPVPVSVENDGKAAILAEAWKGSLAGVRDAACVLLGSGIGGGIIMDSKLQKGAGFAAGEISNMMIMPGQYDKTNALCYDASMTGFLKAVARAKDMDPALFETSGNASSSEKRITGMDVFRWLEEEDEETSAVYRTWIRKLGWLLFNLKLVISPEKIVIGGGVSRNRRFITDLQEEYQRIASVLGEDMPETVIDVCRYEADANLLGAVYNWLQMHQKKELL